MISTRMGCLTQSSSQSNIDSNGEDTIAGSAFLVEERRPKESLEVCEKYIAEGAKLLIMSRDPPQQLLHGSPLKPEKVIWLTNLPGKDRMNPTAVGTLMSEIRKFIDSYDHPFIF